MNALIVGSSGHARVVADMVRLDASYRLVGLIDRFRTVGDFSFGCEILGGESDLPRLVAERAVEAVFFGIGDNFVREKVADHVRQLCPQVMFPVLIHPSAQVAAGVPLGDGCVICAGAIVGAGAQVGRHCLLNTRASLDHDSIMADASSLAPGVVTGGSCSIGARSAIGIGAVLTHGVRVGEDSVVGAGALVNRPLGDHVVAYGTPAKVVRARLEGDRYL